MAKKPANDNTKKFEAFYKELHGFLDDTRKVIKDLRADKATLEKANTEKDAQLEANRQADQSLGERIETTTKEVASMRKAILGAILALVVVGGLIWTGYALRGPGQQVADGKLEKIEQAVNESRKDSKDAKAAAENLLGNVQTLAVAVGKIARDQQSATTAVAAPKKTLPGNWELLKPEERMFYIIEGCSPVDPAWQDTDQKALSSLVAVLKVWHPTKEQAEQFMQTSCKVIDLRASAFRTALDSYAPADEDAAAERQQGVKNAVCDGGGCRLTVAPPTPWIQGGYTRPGYATPAPYGRPGYGYGGRGRPVCGPGQRWSQEFQACASGRKTAGVHQYDIAPERARCRIGEVRVIEVPIPGGVRRVHQTCR